MPRGAEYDTNKAPQSDNPIEAGKTQAHGTGSTVRFPLSLSSSRILPCPVLPGGGTGPITIGCKQKSEAQANYV